MKAREYQKLSKIYLLPNLPGFEVLGGVLYLRPIKYFLLGLSFDNSSFSKNSFTVTAFAQPLFIPRNYIFYSFGSRLGTLSGGPEKWWEITDQNSEEVYAQVLNLIRKEAIPFFESVKTPRKFIRKYKSRSDPPHVHNMEAVAYAMILDGDNRKAARLMQQSLVVLKVAMKKDLNRPWLQETKARVQMINSALHKDPTGAVAQLNTWITETTSFLKLKP